MESAYEPSIIEVDKQLYQHEFYQTIKPTKSFIKPWSQHVFQQTFVPLKMNFKLKIILKSR